MIFVQLNDETLMTVLVLKITKNKTIENEQQKNLPKLFMNLTVEIRHDY